MCISYISGGFLHVWQFQIASRPQSWEEICCQKINSAGDLIFIHFEFKPREIGVAERTGFESEKSLVSLPWVVRTRRRGLGRVVQPLSWTIMLTFSKLVSQRRAGQPCDFWASPGTAHLCKSRIWGPDMEKAGH